MIKKVFLITFIVLALGVLIFLFIPSNIINPDYNSKTEKKVLDNPYIDPSEENSQDIAETTGSDQQSSSSSSSPSQEGCTYQQISYSLQNFVINQSSTEAECSVTVQNLDTTSGEFGIRFRIHQVNTSASTSFDSAIVAGNVQAGQEVQFIHTFSIPFEYQNQELTCSASTSSVPRELVC